MKEFLTLLVGSAVFFYLIASWCAASFDIRTMSESMRAGIACFYCVSILFGSIIIAHIKEKK